MTNTKCKAVIILVALALMLAVIPLNVFATEAGGEAASITISSLEELESFRDEVNSGNTYEGYTVSLTASIVLSGEWTPIGNGSRDGKTYTGSAFKGTFNGNENTITGLTVTSTESSAAVGFFGVVDGGVIKNLVFENVSFNTSSKNAGSAIGLMVGGATADGITVKSGSIIAADGVGGVVGRMTVSGTISNCCNGATVEATASSGGVGGIVGKAYYTEADKLMTISNCTNAAAVTSGYAAGGIVGLSAANVSECSNTASVTATTEAGGIVGEQVMYGTVSGNVNSGLISNNGSGTAYGGIIGWVRYANTTTDYPLYDTIVVSYNTNSGSISASGASLGSGGIVGTVYNQVVVTGNENTAASIVGGTFASGIIGGAQFADSNISIDDATIYAYNNVSTTELAALSANCVALDMYNNAPATFVAENNSSEWIAQIADDKYATLQAAIDASDDGDTVTLLSDVTYTGSDRAVIEGKTLTVDLGGYTITGEYVVVNIKNGADVTIKNGTVRDTTSDACAIQVLGAKATLAENLDVISDVGAAVTVYGKDGYETVLTTYADLITNDTDCDAAISGQGAYDGTVINIDSGTLTSVNGVGIYHPQNGTLNITGGTINANTGIIMKSGALNIIGGTINATGAQADYEYKESGYILTGDAVVIENVGGDTGYETITSVSISGGMFTSANAAAVVSYAATDANADATVIDGFVSGGTFSSDVSEYCAFGYVIEDNGNGSYGLSVIISGDGTEESPYVIDSLEGLKCFRDSVNDGNTYEGLYVELASDIDLANEEWTPIGTYSAPFKGYFNGSGHTISNLKISTASDFVGLFGYVKGTAMTDAVTPSVQNLHIISVDVSCSDNTSRVGGAFGGIWLGYIKNVHVSGTVSGGKWTGGIVGNCYARIDDCSFTGSVSSNNQAGGIVGAGDARVYNCKVVADVTAKWWAGGIIGNGQEGASAVGCYVKGDVSANANWYRGVGGIAGVAGHGYAGSTFENNYFDGNVYLAGEKISSIIIGVVNAESNDDINTVVSGNSWNTEYYDADTTVYVVAADAIGSDASEETWIEGAAEELTTTRNNNLIMLESDIQYVDATSLDDVTIMIFSDVEPDDVSLSTQVGKNAAGVSFKLEDGILYVSYDKEATWVALGEVNGADGTNGIDGSDGRDGEDGVDGKTPSFKVENGELMVSYDDGASWTSLGIIQGADGVDGINGTNGNNGTNGQDGADGTDGVGIAKAEINDNGELVITYTDGSSTNLGVIVGSDGVNGENGKDGVDGKNGIDGQDGKDGVDGENGKDGLAVTAIVIGSTALVGEIALVVWFFLKKEKLF